MLNQRTLQEGLTINQCMAARFLAADGWTWDDLGSLLEVSDETLNHHLNGECQHPEIDEPMDPDGIAPGELRALRHDAGLTQEGLAAELGVTHATVSNWENGKAVPRRWRVRKLKHILSEEGEGS